ncbi:MAG: acyl-CoA desaturase [Polyangiales bacterium]
MAPVRFGHDGAFRADLKRASDAYFASAARPRRDIAAMYLKTAVILTWFVGSWVLLVFFATRAWQGVLLAMSQGLSIAAIGMSVQHDANHGGYSRHAWVNRALGFTLDVMGVCGWFWRQKHNVIHHTYTNIQGVDFDLDFGAIARLSVEQPRRPWHRYQQYYLWFLYCFLLPKWVFHDDFVLLRERRAGPHVLPPMSRTEVALFYGWKVFFVAWSLVIPSLFHPVWQVLLFHLLAASTLGLTLSSVFQLAHCADTAEFPAAPPDGSVICDDWAAHQVDTTVDFAPRNPALTWFLGGLNYQVEHHLFPKVCHLHYPALSAVVADTAAKHGVRDRCHATLRQALASHFRHLERLGRPPRDEPANTAPNTTERAPR